MCLYCKHNLVSYLQLWGHKILFHCSSITDILFLKNIWKAAREPRFFTAWYKCSFALIAEFWNLFLERFWKTILICSATCYLSLVWHLNNLRERIVRTVAAWDILLIRYYIPILLYWEKLAISLFFLLWNSLDFVFSS